MDNEELLKLIDLLLNNVSAYKFRKKFENSKAVLTDYLGLTDSDLISIKSENNKNIAAIKLYFILNDDIDEDVKNRLLDIITKINDKTIITKMVTNIFEKKRSLVLEILETFENGNVENYDYGASVLSLDEIVDRQDFIDILEFVLETEDSMNAKYVFDLAIDSELQQIPYYLEVIKLISLASKDENIREVIDIIINERIQLMPQYLEIVKMVLKIKNKKQAKLTCQIILDEEKQNQPYYLKLIKIIAGAKGIEQATRAKSIAYDDKIALRDDYLEVVRLIASALDSEKAYEIAINPKFQKKKKYLRLIEKAAMTDK